MLFKTKTLESYKLHAEDGEIGSASDFYFDDQHWTIRYLVADTSGWITGRQVLISPYALESVHKDTHQIGVNLTKAQIEGSPSLDTHKPVSRQFEVAYSGYYGWPTYWGGPSTWGAYPTAAHDPSLGGMPAPSHRKEGDAHLRSTLAVTGYHIHATDGEIGHVEDFIVDDKTWTIRYLVVKTRNWWPGKKVLVSPQWIERVSWDEQQVFVKLTREAIQASPEYSEETAVSEDYESKLFGHYRFDDCGSKDATSKETTVHHS
jgi:hypothetical protein